MELLLSLWGKLPTLLDGLANIIAGATLIAVLTPTSKDDTFLAKLREWIGIISGNIGHNK